MNSYFLGAFKGLETMFRSNLRSIRRIMYLVVEFIPSAGKELFLQNGYIVAVWAKKGILVVSVILRRVSMLKKKKELL